GYYSILAYAVDDRNGNHTVDPGELGNFLYASNVDPNNPNSASSPNITDPNLKAPVTDEFAVGLEHEIIPQFVAGVTYTHRIRKDLIYYPLAGVSPSDYVLTDLNPASGPLCEIGSHGGCIARDLNGNVLGETGPIYGVANYTGNSGLLQTNRPGF